MRVRCISSRCSEFTVGKIYETKGRSFYNDYGYEYTSWSPNGATLENLGKWFKIYGIIFEEVKEMTKKDLKVGYVVVYNNGYIGMVMPSKEDGLITVSKNGYLLLDDSNDDLTRVYNDGFTIKEVYGLSKYCGDTFGISTENRELLWQREKPIKEVTMSELEKMYGCEVKIINDKGV